MNVEVLAIFEELMFGVTLVDMQVCRGGSRSQRVHLGLQLTKGILVFANWQY